jgi:hypothetical protein
MSDYRKPGVYLEESLLINTGDTSSATSLALFVGPASTGPTDLPVRCDTWSDYVVNFGGFDTIKSTNPVASYTSYLPYAVYSYFQNGGKPCYIQRATGDDIGQKAYVVVTDGTTITQKSITSRTIVDGVVTVTVTGHGLNTNDYVTISGYTSGDEDINGSYIVTYLTDNTFKFTNTNLANASAGAGSGSPVVNADGHTSFIANARSAGTSGNDISISVNYTDTSNEVFTLAVYKNSVEVERFQYLTMTGDYLGTRKVDTAINDPYSGSSFVRISNASSSNPNINISTIQAFEHGTDPDVPSIDDYLTPTENAVSKIEGPIILNLVGYTPDINDVNACVVPNVVPAGTFDSRGDVFYINDSVKARAYGDTSAAYMGQNRSTLTSNTGDSYTASFTPWIIIPDPKKSGNTITIPPGGAVAGVISRIDSTIGVFRAPAGLVAGITNSIGVDTKFSDSELGELNSLNINVIRPVVGSGIAIMGARTRNQYGVTRYISARRTLIYIKESLRRSSQFALFENNDQRLWTQLQMSAERLLRPLWEAGGLRGNNTSEAYYIKCDSTLNTPAAIAAGEVRMEIGVALEYPAEFIVIRVTQFESGGFAAEVQPKG